MYREFELGTGAAQPKVNERLRDDDGEQDVIVRHALRYPPCLDSPQKMILLSFRHEDDVAQGGPEKKNQRHTRR